MLVSDNTVLIFRIVSSGTGVVEAAIFVPSHIAKVAAPAGSHGARGKQVFVIASKKISRTPLRLKRRNGGK